MEETQTLSNLRGVLRRRKRTFLVVSIPVLAVALVTAFVLPPVYKATARVLIEEQQIPPEFVRTTVTSFVEERIEQITQQVMSRSTLLDIIRRFNLYADRVKHDPMDEIIEDMRRAIQLKTVSAAGAGRKGGFLPSASATVAFTISFEGEDPGKVQRVTDNLASLYLNENLKNREQRASTTTAFLQQELDEVRKQTQELEARISAFKRAHPGELPEYTGLNLQAAERAERDLDTLRAEARAAEERKVYLTGQLASVEAFPPATVGEQQPSDAGSHLRQLRLRLTLLRGTVSDDHPDVKSLRKSIRELEAQAGPVADSPAERSAQVSALREELGKKQRELGPKHPDVLGLSRKLAQLEKEAAAPAAVPAPAEGSSPAAITLKSQLATTEMEIRSLGEQRRAVEAKLRQYRDRIARAPVAEQEYVQLTQDYQSARGKYDELLKKLMEARVAQGMEESQRGERFTIVDPASFPGRPFKPNRVAICLIGVVLAIGAGIGAAAAQESLDSSLKTPTEVQELFGLPVLSVFPYIGDAERKPRLNRVLLLSIAAMVVLLVIGLVLVHFFVSPLDVMWFRVLRKIR